LLPIVLHGDLFLPAIRDIPADARKALIRTKFFSIQLVTDRYSIEQDSATMTTKTQSIVGEGRGEGCEQRSGCPPHPPVASRRAPPSPTRGEVTASPPIHLHSACISRVSAKPRGMRQALLGTASHRWIEAHLRVPALPSHPPAIFGMSQTSLSCVKRAA
jgi:hypothetical protein